MKYMYVCIYLLSFSVFSGLICELVFILKIIQGHFPVFLFFEALTIRKEFPFPEYELECASTPGPSKDSFFIFERF